VAEYLIICVDRSGADREHRHVERVGVQLIPHGGRRILDVREVRRLIKLGINRYFSTDGHGHLVEVQRRTCGCGRKTIDVAGNDTTEEDLLAQGACND